MGNCLKSPEHGAADRNNMDPLKLKVIGHSQNYVNINNIGKDNELSPDECNLNEDFETEMDSQPRRMPSSDALTEKNKGDPSWLRFLSQNKPGSPQSNDDECSIFGENWDTELFNQRLQTPNKTRQSDMTEQSPMVKVPIGNWNNWNSDENLGVKFYPKGPRLAVISSSLLGFCNYPSEFVNTVEWFRNGEIESPEPDTNDYLIKGKRYQGGRNNEDNASTPMAKDTYTLHEGWLRYTMFLHQDKSELYSFYSKFRTAKHIFLSLELKTGCEIRISKPLFVYRSKLVRVFVIDGPSRKHIIRCYSSLPDVITKLLICGCERPSVVEPRQLAHTTETGFILPTMLQRPVLV